MSDRATSAIALSSDLDSLRALCRDHGVSTEGLALDDRDALFESLIVGAHALGPAELAGFAYELGALGERALIEQELRRRDEALAELESALAAAGPPLEDDRFDRLAVLTHQINNPLTSLLGRAQILQMKQREDPVVERGLSIITESAQRIAALVREVASIVRHGKLDASRLSTPDR